MKAIYFSISLAVSAVLGTNCAMAQGWTLQQCIDYALENNIQVKLSQAQIESGKLQVDDSKHSFLPQLNGSVSESFNFGRGLTAANTYANRNTSNFSVGAQFSLPLFSGLRNSRTLAQSRLNLAQLMWQLEETRDNVTLNVIAQYLQVLYNKEVMETAANQVALSTFELERRSSLASAGKIAEVEVLEAESQLAQDKLTGVNARNDYSLALLDLSQLLQLESTDGFDVVALDSEDPQVPKFENVYSRALDINNGLKSAEANVETAKAGISVAQTGYIPTLSLNGGIGSSYYKLNGVDNLSFGKQMRENYSTYIGLSLNVPLFDAFSTRTAVKRAKVQLLSAQLQADQTRNELYKTIQQAWVQANGAREKYLTALTSCDAAQVSFDAMTEKYNLGRATSTEYEQSKANLFAAKIQKLQARYEYLLRCRLLNYYQGL